jgi:hypothetical protein
MSLFNVKNKPHVMKYLKFYINKLYAQPHLKMVILRTFPYRLFISKVFRSCIKNATCIPYVMTDLFCITER